VSTEHRVSLNYGTDLNCSFAGFVPIAVDKSHARIIWDCAWAQEGDVFGTASRDKTVRVSLPSSVLLLIYYAGQNMEARGQRARQEVDTSGFDQNSRGCYSRCVCV
jgi:hypothetical protein